VVIVENQSGIGRDSLIRQQLGDGNQGAIARPAHRAARRARRSLLFMTRLRMGRWNTLMRGAAVDPEERPEGRRLDDKPHRSGQPQTSKGAGHVPAREIIESRSATQLRTLDAITSVRAFLEEGQDAPGAAPSA
jgi:hypothetical protein